MTNLDRIVALLERERYARRWDDRHVAGEILAELGVDPAAETVTDAELHAAEGSSVMRDAQSAAPVALTSSDMEHG